MEFRAWDTEDTDGKVTEGAQENKVGMERQVPGIICTADGKVPGRRKEGVYAVKAQMEPLKNQHLCEGAWGRCTQGNHYVCVTTLWGYNRHTV